jgi:hypothetical protein
MPESIPEYRERNLGMNVIGNTTSKNSCYYFGLLATDSPGIVDISTGRCQAKDVFRGSVITLPVILSQYIEDNVHFHVMGVSNAKVYAIYIQ